MSDNLSQAELADALFNDEVMSALVFVNTHPVNWDNETPVVSGATRQRLVRALRQIFASKSGDTDASPGDLDRNERLKQHIVGFPDLIVAGLANDKELKEMRDTYRIPLTSSTAPYAGYSAEKRAELVSQLEGQTRAMMIAAGIVPPVTEETSNL